MTVGVCLGLGRTYQNLYRTVSYKSGFADYLYQWFPSYAPAEHCCSATEIQ